MLREWTEPPAMSATAPAPALLSSDGTLWLAYRIARDPHHCAVLRFHHVGHYAWGAPPAAYYAIECVDGTIRVVDAEKNKNWQLTKVEIRLAHDPAAGSALTIIFSARPTSMPPR